MQILKKHYPVIIAVTVLALAVIGSFIFSLRVNGGNFIYILDDTYIHMAVAKNFVEHGVWGVTKFGFTSSTSSPLWILLLIAAYFLTGVNAITPFVLNLIFGISVCVIAYILLKKYKIPGLPMLFILLSFIFFTPIPAMIFLGMEHLMHLLFTIIFVYISAHVLSQEKTDRGKQTLLLVLAPLLLTARYEGVFLLLTVCMLFLFRKRFLYAFSLGFLGISLVAIYGLVSVSNGWHFLPNSILTRVYFAGPQSIKSFIKYCFDGCWNIFFNPQVLVLWLVSLSLYIHGFNLRKKAWDEKQLLLAMFILVTFLHMQFAKAGWFYRYESYIMGLGVFVIGAVASGYFGKHSKISLDRKRIPPYIAYAFLGCFIMLPLFWRAYYSLREIPVIAHERYLQHYTSVLFLNKYYPSATIVTDDIGMISFYGEDIKFIDVMALANCKSFHSKDELRACAEKNKAVFAHLPPNWRGVFGIVPDEWEEVAKWRLPYNFICVSLEYPWYCINKEDRPAMVKNFKEFAGMMPPDMEQEVFR